MPPHGERHLNERRLLIATDTLLFLKTDVSSECLFRPFAPLHAVKLLRARSCAFLLGIFEVGISCISAHQPTGVKLNDTRDGGGQSVRQSRD